MVDLQFTFTFGDADRCLILRAKFLFGVLGDALMVGWFTCCFFAVISCETDDIDDASWSIVGSVFYRALVSSWGAVGYVVLLGSDRGCGLVFALYTLAWGQYASDVAAQVCDPLGST